MKSYIWGMIALLLIALSLISCSQPEEVTVPNGGVAITFDDHHFKDWLKADSLFKAYEWKATFCVSLIGSRSPEDIQKMHALHAAGHEIAGHGYLHVHAAAYVALKGLDTYINDEIIPLIEHFEQDSIIDLRAYAYPYGSHHVSIDNELINYFDIVRGIKNGNRSPERSPCYFNNSTTVYALGLDHHLYHFSLDYFLDLLAYAHQEGKIMIFYAHRPLETVTGDYQVSLETLETICQYVWEHQMHFYTLSDLADMIDD